MDKEDDDAYDDLDELEKLNDDDDDDDDDDDEYCRWVVVPFNQTISLCNHRFASCPISTAPQLPLRRRVMVGDTQNAMTTLVGLVKKSGKKILHTLPLKLPFLVGFPFCFWGGTQQHDCLNPKNLRLHCAAGSGCSSQTTRPEEGRRNQQRRFFCFASDPIFLSGWMVFG